MTKYFQNYQDAMEFVRNAGLQQKPVQKNVWIYPAHELVWSVTI